MLPGYRNDQLLMLSQQIAQLRLRQTGNFRHKAAQVGFDNYGRTKLRHNMVNDRRDLSRMNFPSHPQSRFNRPLNPGMAQRSMLTRKMVAAFWRNHEGIQQGL